MKLFKDTKILTNFTSFSDCLSFLSKENFNSTRQFSKFLGFENPSLLSDIINKKRKPSPKVIESFLKKFELNYFIKQYLWNLYKIETAAHTDSFIKENELIKSFWNLTITKDLKLTTSDLVVKTLVEDFYGTLTDNEIKIKTKKILSDTQVHISIEKLLALNFIIRDKSERLKLNSELKVFDKTSPESMLDIHKMIERVINEKTGRSFSSVMVTMIDEDSIAEINKIILEAFEKISLIMIEQEKNHDLSKIKKLYLMYLNNISLDL